jgi:arylsulfatase A-like enzyme
MLGLATFAAAEWVQAASRAPRPNFVVVYCDDLGYADLSLNGHPTIRTPNIDQMAREGTQLTSFCAAPVCTPSRGMLLTGRYPTRTGLINVTGPGSPQGIRQGEITIADALKTQGYRTAMFGKWHIGDFDTNPAFNPTAHGFDTFLGLPYSHDYNPTAGVPLYRDTKKVEQPVVYNTLTQRYTEEAIRFMRASAGRPFFVELAHNMPHIPIGTSDRFKGHSRAGRYGDVIEEIDWSVGEVLRTVKQMGIDRKTVVVFTSDNGPWASTLLQTYDRKERGDKLPGDVGWSGLLRGSKGSTYEGGYRVPAVFRWPGTIPAGRVSADLACIMDLFPTFVGLAGGKAPADRPFDGVDIFPLLKGTAETPRKELFYFAGANIQAVRQGSWKLRIGPAEGAGRGAAQAAGAQGAARGGAAQTGAGAEGAARAGAAQAAAGRQGVAVEPVTELFNLDVDPSERINVAADRPDLVAQLQARIHAFQAELKASSRPPTAFIETVSAID